MLIDYAKFFLAPKFTNGRWPAYLFTVDQFCHYLAIIGIYLAISPQQTQLILNPNWLILALFFLIITKPINIIFKLYLERYQVELEDTSSISGAGAMVGNLERLIIGIFLILGQYAAIALVFTAKSIARYDMISKNQGFAEYYLIGSLFSMISVLVTYALLIF